MKNRKRHESEQDHEPIAVCSHKNHGLHVIDHSVDKGRLDGVRTGDKKFIAGCRVREHTLSCGLFHALLASPKLLKCSTQTYRNGVPISRSRIVRLRLKTVKRNDDISLCFPAISRKEKVNTAIVDVGGVLQEAVDHVSDGRRSICTEK